MKNWRFPTNILLYFENGTRYGHSYNGRPLTDPPHCTKCNSPSIIGQCTNHRIAVQWSLALQFKCVLKGLRGAGL